jgi:hypothetical protein
MKLTTWMAVVALALMLTACEAGAPSPHAGLAATMRTRAQGDEGRVVGSFTRVGGPLGAGGQQPPTVPLSGTVSFSAAHRSTVAVRVGKSGQFSVRLPAGAYRVSGSSPSILEVLASGATRESPCSQQVTVTAVASKTVRIAVICAVP